MRSQQDGTSGGESSEFEPYKRRSVDEGLGTDGVDNLSLIRERAKGPAVINQCLIGTESCVLSFFRWQTDRGQNCGIM